MEKNYNNQKKDYAASVNGVFNSEIVIPQSTMNDLEKLVHEDLVNKYKSNYKDYANFILELDDLENECHEKLDSCWHNILVSGLRETKKISKFKNAAKTVKQGYISEGNIKDSLYGLSILTNYVNTKNLEGYGEITKIFEEIEQKPNRFWNKINTEPLKKLNTLDSLKYLKNIALENGRPNINIQYTASLNKIKNNIEESLKSLEHKGVLHIDPSVTSNKVYNEIIPKFNKALSLLNKEEKISGSLKDLVKNYLILKTERTEKLKEIDKQLGETFLDSTIPSEAYKCLVEAYLIYKHHDLSEMVSENQLNLLELESELENLEEFTEYTKNGIFQFGTASSIHSHNEIDPYFLVNQLEKDTETYKQILSNFKVIKDKEIKKEEQAIPKHPYKTKIETKEIKIKEIPLEIKVEQEILSKISTLNGSEELLNIDNKKRINYFVNDFMIPNLEDKQIKKLTKKLSSSKLGKTMKRRDQRLTKIEFRNLFDDIELFYQKNKKIPNRRNINKLIVSCREE